MTASLNYITNILKFFQKLLLLRKVITKMNLQYMITLYRI